MDLEKISDKLKTFGIATTDILHYEHAPLKKEFQSITDFYNATLDNLKLYGLSPAVFYITNYNYFRAMAWRKNNLGIVNISPIVVNYLIENIRNDQSNLNIILDGSIKQGTHFIEGLNDFMYWSTLHYIIYHESAHLIQNQNKNSPDAIDLDGSQGDAAIFDLHIHALEIDADEFAALSIGKHLVQYFDQLNNLNITLSSDKLNHYIIGSLAPIMLTLIEQHPYFNKFYIRKMKHPHPAIRLVYMSLTLLNYLNQAYIIPNRLDGLNLTFIIKNSLIAASEHLRITKNDFRVQMIPEMVSKNFTDIINYFDELREKQKKVEILAVTAWNINAKK